MPRTLAYTGKTDSGYMDRGIRLLRCALMLCSVSIWAVTCYAGNDVLGEIQLEGAAKVEKTSGVLIDGQYLGYLDELKGSKKIPLLPGEHKIAVRQNGYQDFTRELRFAARTEATDRSEDGQGSALQDAARYCRNQIIYHSRSCGSFLGWFIRGPRR